jgi:isopenicillin-N epimerase
VASELAKHWGLDPEIAHLNHGSFGACPRVVLEELHGLQRELERDLGSFLNRTGAARLAEARCGLGAFLNAGPDDLAFVPNVTFAINSVLRSFPLEAGDELLVCNHEYNASRNVLDFVAERAGCRVVVVDLPFPIDGPEVVVERFRAAITDRTRLALIDHVTSSTGLVMPLAELIACFRERGVAVVVDGAHAPGMIDVDLAALDADYYGANCHKWICSPKGAGFLYVRRELQHQVRPAVISHGANAGLEGNARFRAEFEWMGTRDITPWLCVPKAIDTMASFVAGGWLEVKARNHALVVAGRRAICERLGLATSCPEEMLGSLATIHLPASDNFGESASATTLGLDPLQEQLFHEHRIEVPVLRCPSSGRRMVRVSAQLYNDLPQYERLGVALAELL